MREEKSMSLRLCCMGWLWCKLDAAGNYRRSLESLDVSIGLWFFCDC